MFLLIFTYVSLFLFIYLSVRKAKQYAMMPFHGRLDLYPIPKEKGKTKYGGSYMEETKWWEKPREISLVAEMKEMFKEMLFIKKLFDHQQPFWWLSYSLHLGFYLLAAWTVMVFLGAAMELAGFTVPSDNGWSTLVYYITFCTGGAGLILTGIGSLALLLKRVSVESFKKYTTPQEYFNLIFILIVDITGIIVWLGDPGFEYGRSIALSLLSFKPIQAGGIISLHIILLGLLLVYIPLTKMSHYVAKHFTFHILWDNEPNLKNSEVEKKVRENAGFKPRKTWSAPHFLPTNVNQGE